MALLEVDLNPDRKSLRTFGVICLVAFALIGTWIKFRHAFLFFEMSAETAAGIAWVAWVMAGLGGLAGLLAPGALKLLYIGLTVISFPIGLVISSVVVAVLFYGVLVPLGLVLRGLRMDPLTREFVADLESYWRPRKQVADVTQYYRQY